MMAHLAAIVESSDDAIISKDLNGIVLSWNSAATRMFGYSADEMIGRSIVRLFPKDRRNEEDIILARLRAGDRVDHFQTVRQTRDGRLIHVSLTISPILDRDGVVVGASKIARDITVEKQLQEERDRLLERERELRLEAERSNRIKDEFLATLSHELRTPLMAIHGWGQILGHGNANEEMIRRAAEVITRNTHAQSQLIEELLDMNRILMGKLRLDLQPVDLCAIIEAVVDSLGPSSSEKAIQLRKMLDPRAGAIRGDPLRLQQIVWNLLTNAIKFTEKGGTVEVLLERVNSHVEITVNDDGIGIDPDFLPCVFDRFIQKESSMTRRHSGLGLGLAIVKHLVELHGGTISAKSPGLGHGASFRVNLPFPLAMHRTPAEVHPHGRPHASSAWEQPNLSGRCILVIDDDRDAAELIDQILSTAGAEVERVHSARSGIESLSTRDYDLLISDIGMPEMDGFQMIQEIRKMDGKARGVPAVALTAFGRSEDRRNAMVSGFDVFLSKPIDSPELVATVARLLSRVE
jgi:PAS domain S-box